MPYIKKLVIRGFKSFQKETEILFSNSMNVIVGPNGSGKSNITDAICFVLGRLSIKSMRASKASNLIFAGTKAYKPAKEASVKLVFDNSDKKFSLPDKEIVLERIVRKNSQGIYKINKETKTRQEVLELLSHAGIDPYGFNIVLQGEISRLIKVNSEERRKIIEEVAGISIYEMRKEKSLKEFEKTENRLKEVAISLREKDTYLRNLDQERKQALRYNKLQFLAKKYKASIIKKKLDVVKKKISLLEQGKEEKEKSRNNLKEKSEKIQRAIQESEQEISNLNNKMQNSTGIEQDKLNDEISNLRAELVGLDVREENNKEKSEEINLKRKKAEQEILDIKEKIFELRKEFPSQTKKYKELEIKKQELEKIDDQKKIFYNLRERLNTLKERIKDREVLQQKNKNESDFLIKEIDKISEDIIFKDIELCKGNIQKLAKQEKEQQDSLQKKENELNEKEKLNSVINSELSNLNKIKRQVTELDVCPLCKSKMTKEHITEVFRECDEKISELNKKFNEFKEKKIDEEISRIKSVLQEIQAEFSKANADLIKLKNTEEKKEQIKKLYKEQEIFSSEISDFKKEINILERELSKFKDIEETYDKIFLEIQEISSRTEENLNAELEFKERSLETARVSIKQFFREEEELKQDLEDIEESIDEKKEELLEREREREILERKFKTLFDKKTKIEKEIHNNNSLNLQLHNSIGSIDVEISNLKIEIARFDAERKNLEIDFQDYKTIQVFNIQVEILQSKLSKLELVLQNIGSINQRALELYEKLKKECDIIAEKMSVLENEKNEILRIIEEIDKKKIKTFNRTLRAINEIFSRNFSQLYTKGGAFLELENKEEPFAGGINIIIKVGKGKYFDVSSLSGGEQTLVALSLIFAIQEYNPYSFYIFDEVDAALDKRNSERLSLLIKKHMKSGQYIIITHNDAIITESTTLYGISMQEGVSKILSVEI